MIHRENLKELEFRRTGSKARSSNISMFVSRGGGGEATDDTTRSSVLSPVLKERLCEILILSNLNDVNTARLGE